MSYSKVKSSFRPCSSSTSDQESMSAKKPTITNSTNNNKSPVPVIANCGVTKDMLHRKKSDGSVSDASTHSHLAGGKLTEAPGRLTPTCPGRMKAPPVCRNWALKRGASSDQDFKCFSPELAQRCAEKCLAVAGRNHDMNVEEIPFNIEGSIPEGVPCTECKPSMSSTSTVVTNTSSSFGAIGDVQAIVPRSVKEPPLKVVRTDDSIVNSEDETKVVPVGETIEKTTPSPPASPKHPSSSYTDKLIKDAQSRQGRSLQRWLVHPETESLVREVAGSIPITSDGRVVLVSASRKNEWILPKGGWDSDETKEECAIRETYEEAGLLGKLGSCLAPIDYESGKSKKRRLQHATSSEGLPPATKKAKLQHATSSQGLPPATEKAKTVLKDSETTCSDSSPESVKSSFIRLILFPLYLTEVKSEWPEKGRLRKIVEIDEAIRIMEQENRLYFKKGLEMVKEKGLHMIHKN